MISEIDKLREENNQLEEIFESSFDEIIVTDQNGIVIKANSICETNYDISANKMIGKHVKELEENKVFSPSASLLVIEGKKPIELLQKTETGRYLNVRARPVFDKSGNFIRVICYSRDLTELVNLKKKIEEMEEEQETYRQEISFFRDYNGLIYESNSMNKVLEIIGRVAKVDTTILILGETGVGKSLISKILHKSSLRKDSTFNEINCATLSEQLIESELYGYERGAFTGARKEGKVGLIEASHNGTLFLDEIGELPLHLQGKLLQVIQEKKIRRIGSEKTMEIDVRFIVATNRNLEKMVEKGEFRKDLYYRLSIIPIYIPPLRERREDILPLVYSYIDYFNKLYSRNIRLSPKVLDTLVEYNWEGNIREIRNLIERLVITCDELVTVQDLPVHLTKKLEGVRNEKLDEILESVERTVIINAYNKNKSSYKVADKLGISQSSAARKIKKYIQ